MAAKRRGPAYWNTRITQALGPGMFIGWREVSGFFQDLDTVVDEILSTQAPSDAARWLETLYAGLTAKMNEIHDEGESAMFADDLAVAWISARMKAKADPDETVRKLLHWGDTDDYGLLGEITEPMLKALGARGRVALRQARPDNVNLSKSIAESNGDASPRFGDSR